MDLRHAEKEFLNYVSQFNLEDKNIERKSLHSIRVAKIAKQIATKMGLPKEQIEIAAMIGQLHDVGRFVQYTKFATYADAKTFDHGDVGVELLKKDNLIRKFYVEEQYDELILKAIKNHNKYEIEEGLSEQEMLFAKLIRDADKIDIFYEGCEIFWEDDIEKINHSRPSERLLEELKQEKTVKNQASDRFDDIDAVLRLMAFVYDLNYQESFEILQEEDYMNKMLNRFQLEDEEAREKVSSFQTKINEYIAKRIKEKVNW